MSNESAPVSRRWREEGSAEPPAARAAAGPRRIFVATLLLLLLAVVVAGVLSRAGGRPPTYLVPLRVPPARGLAPVPTAGDLEALARGDLFAAVGEGAAGGERGTLQARLDALRDRPAHESLIVYLSGRAAAAGGRVVITPSDARRGGDDGLPLSDVLRALAGAPARHKLIVLDVMWPTSPADDVAGLVADEAAAAADPRLLVLCACGPGQAPQAIDGTGRSAFGYYFEEGLRGWAAPEGAPRVGAEALAHFLQARVDRWAQRNRAARQTPVLLGTGDDFPLALVPGGGRATHAEAPAAAEYPDWLRDAWKVRDEWRQGTAWHDAPAEFRRLEEALIAAEADWRGGEAPERVRREWLDERERLEDRLRQARAVSRPAPHSLALAASLGARPDAALVDGVRELLARPPAAPAKPGEPDRAAADLADKLKGKSHFEAAWAAFEALAADPHPTPEKVRLLDAALAAEEPRPRFVETLFLRRLADLSRQVGPSDWPEVTVRQALNVVRRGERAAGRPQAFHGVADALERAAQQRHDAETLLFAAGYAPHRDTARLLTAAEAGYAAVLDAEDAAEAAGRALDEARALLPAYLAYLDRLPDEERASALARRHQEAARVTAELSRAWSSAGPGELRRLGATLTADLDVLRRPFTDEAMKRLLEESRRPDARAVTYREIDAVLAAPYLSADGRAGAWAAARDLGQRLSDATLALDRDEGRARPDGAAARGVPTEAAAWQREQAARARRRAETVAALRRAEEAPRATVEAAALWAWLAERCAYEARDSGAEAFYAAAGRDYVRAAGVAVPDPAAVRFRAPPTALDLAPDHRSATALFSVELSDNVRSPADVRFDVLTPDRGWLEAALDAAALKGAAAGGPARSFPLPVRVTLGAEAEQSPAPPPRGFLLQARVGGRSFSAAVPVGLAAVRDRLEAFLSTDASKPSAPLTDVRLRPVDVPEAFYLYLRNPGDRPRSLRVELSAGERLLQGTITLPPRETVRVKFPPPAAPPVAAVPAVPPAPAAPVRLEPVEGPVAVRLYDTERNNALALRQEFRVSVAEPREYVRVAGVRFDPPGPATGGKNRLEVTLQAAAPLSAPPCVARLTVPDRRAGGRPPPSGTLSGELPPPDEALKLFAEQLPAPPGGEGPAWVDVDGFERAFVYRVGYANGGGPVVPREDRDVALRLRASPYAVSGRLSVRAEVDNAPTGSSLEISLGRVSGAGFEADAARKFPTPREVRVGFAQGDDGALLFAGAIRDWSVELAAAQVRGRRSLRARLLGADGNIVRTAWQTVVLDDRKPEDVQFVELPPLVRQGTLLPVKAVGRADVAGVKEVRFFVGAPPADGKLPPGTATVAGESLDSSGRLWGARLKLPADRKGPLDLGVQFVSSVGLVTFARGSVELVDYDPEKVAPGGIHGVVMLGGRPQAGLDVVLSDEKGAAKGKAKSAADGSFAFETLPPGKYRVSSSKPGSASDRRGQADVTVPPGKQAEARIDLYLP